MIVLPEGEEILDVICGPNDFWVITSTQNIAHVKPAKEGAATNMNLITASGEVYSFLLTEKNGSSMPALKVYVNADPTRRRVSRSSIARLRWKPFTPSLRKREPAWKPRTGGPWNRSRRSSKSIRQSCSARTARPREHLDDAQHLHARGRQLTSGSGRSTRRTVVSRFGPKWSQIGDRATFGCGGK